MTHTHKSVLPLNSKMPSLETRKSARAPLQPPPPPPPPPLLSPPLRPSLALATASCLRHEGLRRSWCSAGFGDRAPWQKLWEAAFADGEEESEDEEEEEEEGETRRGGSGSFDRDADDSVDRAAPVVRLAASLAARERVQAEVCGPRCVGAGCLVAATEIDAALSSSGGGGGGRRKPLRVALAALLADVERREGGRGDDDDDDASRSSSSSNLLLRHSPDASLPPAPSPRFVPLPSQVEAITKIDEALSSGARFVALSEEEEAGGGKAAVAAAAARAFLRRARAAEDKGGGGGGAREAGISFSVSTSWDSAFWLDARGLGQGAEAGGAGEDDVFPASDSPSSAAADDNDDDEDPSAAAFRALLAALGGSAVPGTPDRDRVLLRARSLFGDAAPAGGGSGGSGGGGGGRAPRRTAGLVVRLGERRRQRQQRGLLSALLELLDASAGLSVVVIGTMEETSGVFAPDATVVLHPLSEAEARLFLRESGGGAAAAAEEEMGGFEGELPPFLKDVRVLRAAAGLGITSPRRLLGEDLGRTTAADEKKSPPPRRAAALGSLLARRAPAALLLRLSRLSSALLCGRGGTFTVFSASVVFNCSCEQALEHLRELQALGLAHPAEGVSATTVMATTVMATTAASAASSSSSSPSSCPSSAAASWSLSSLAASVGQDLSEELGLSSASSSSALVTLARVAEAASATLETSLAFARGGGGSGGERNAHFSPTTGGHALASHWISKERALFLSAPLLAERLRRESATKEKDTNGNKRVLSSVALSSLSMLLWRGGDKLLPGLLGFEVHASLARNVEAAAVAAAVSAAAAAAGAGGGGKEEEEAEGFFRAHAARASWSLGAALCSRGRWQEARDPLLRALRDSESGSFPHSGENGRHRIVSWIARVEYKVKGVSESFGFF